MRELRENLKDGLDLMRKEKKDKYQIMYVDYAYDSKIVQTFLNGTLRTYKIGEDMIYGSGTIKQFTLNNCATDIINRIKNDRVIIYIDNRGFGLALYDLLKENEDILVQPLYIRKTK